MTNPLASPDSKALSWLPVTTLASGMELRIPIHHIIGAQPGPVVGVTAGIHGDEYLPIEVVRRLVRLSTDRRLVRVTADGLPSSVSVRSYIGVQTPLYTYAVLFKVADVPSVLQSLSIRWSTMSAPADVALQA